MCCRTEESDLEDLTCTDIEQQWGALKASTMADYKAKLLVELCQVEAVRSVNVSMVPEVTKETEKEWANRLIASKHKSHIPEPYH